MGVMSPELSSRYVLINIYEIIHSSITDYYLGIMLVVHEAWFGWINDIFV